MSSARLSSVMLKGALLTIALVFSMGCQSSSQDRNWQMMLARRRSFERFLLGEWTIKEPPQVFVRALGDVKSMTFMPAYQQKVEGNESVGFVLLKGTESEIYAYMLSINGDEDIAELRLQRDTSVYNFQVAPAPTAGQILVTSPFYKDVKFTMTAARGVPSPGLIYLGRMTEKLREYPEPKIKDDN